MVLYMFQVLFMPCVWYFIKVFLSLQKITKATFKTLHSVGLWFLKVTEHIFNILPFPPVIALKVMNTLSKQFLNVVVFYLIASCRGYLNDNVGQRRVVLKFQHYNLKRERKKEKERKKKKSHY